MSWDIIALGDIFKVTSGGTPSRRKPEFYENGDIHWVKTGDLHNKYVEAASEFITQEALDSSSTKLYPPGTVLIAMYGATIGACSILNIEACTNQACAAFTPNDNVDTQYLYYLLKSKKDTFVRAGAGGAQPNISATFLKQFKIPLPPLAIQKQIAGVLDKADTLRGQCQQMEQELNTLAQSVFLDMFGDPVKNPKKWDIEKFENYIEYIGDIGSNGSNATISANLEMLDEENYALMVRTTNFNKKDFTDNVKYVSKKTYDFFKKSQIFGGEIIMNKIGSAGQLWIMPELNKPVSLGLNQFVIRLKNLNTDYLFYYLSTEFGQKVIQSKLNGATTKSITKGAVKELPLMLPPIELQNKFSEFIQKNKALAPNKLQIELENNFNSLMQRAFKGELDLKGVV